MSPAKAQFSRRRNSQASRLHFQTSCVEQATCVDQATLQYILLRQFREEASRRGRDRAPLLFFRLDLYPEVCRPIIGVFARFLDQTASPREQMEIEGLAALVLQASL